MQVGILGAGFSGKMIGKAFADDGIAVWGTSRSAEKFDALQASGIEPVLFDGETAKGDLLSALARTTHLIVSVAPPRQENSEHPDATVDPVLRALADHALGDIAPSLQWIGYLSTVGVYGDHGGAWVDEEVPAAPASERSRQRVRAEAEWLAIGESNNIPVGVFRLSGIYGPGRNALVTAQAGKGRRLVKEGQVFNRIHVGDIAQALTKAAHMNAAGVFNITDNEPSPPQDVVTFAHDLLGLTPPDEIDFETADLSPMARSFYGENKRVANAKSRSVLGMEYQWPNYRVALTRMLEENDWR